MSSSWEKAQKNRFEKEDELKSLAEARKQELEKRAKLAKKQDEEIEKLTRMSSELADAKIQAEIELEETQRQIAEARLKRSKRIVKRRRSNRKLLGGNNVEIPRAVTLDLRRGGFTTAREEDVWVSSSKTKKKTKKKSNSETRPS